MTKEAAEKKPKVKVDSSSLIKKSFIKFIKKAPVLLILLLCFLVVKPIDAFSAPVPIENPSFEANVPEDGGWIINEALGDNINIINDWTITNEGGTWRPTDIPFPDGAHDGVNCAYVNADCSISQPLSEIVQTGFVYTLQVYVGRRTGYDPLEL